MNQVKQAYQYAEDILNGKRPVSSITRQSIDRFEKDLKDPRFRFNEERVQKFLKATNRLRFKKGKGSGAYIYLQDWQVFYYANLIGFEWADSGRRRFSTSYLFVPRKNGKSTMSGILGIDTLYRYKDSPEIYSAANTKDQARITFEEGKRLIKTSTYHQAKVKIGRFMVEHYKNDGIWKPLSARDDTLDGLNPSLAIVDELHAAPNSLVYDVIKSGMGARDEPLLSTITTAGNDMGFAYEMHKMVEGILGGIVDNDAFFALAYTPDKNQVDEWSSRELWEQVNPNIGVSCSWEYLEEQYLEATQIPSSERNFKTKHLNIWMPGTVKTWLSLQEWENDARIDFNELKEAECVGALDLASVSDLACFLLMFSVRDSYAILPFFFIPEKAYEESKKKWVNYEQWVRNGLMTVTPGNTTDYTVIRDCIKEQLSRFNVSPIMYDDWNSSSLIAELTEMGAECRPIRQGFKSLSAPMKQIERLAKEKRIITNQNPLLAWQVNNTVPSIDPAGNKKPDKSKSRSKIDGVVCMVMAMAEYMNRELEAASGGIWIDVI